MKISIIIEKPRAKWLNDILKSKKSAVHKNLTRPSRQQQKLNLKKELEK